MFIKNWKKEIFTIPNLLSLFRLVLIPVYANIYLNAKDNFAYFLAGAIMAVSCITDLIDGKIARRYNMVSTVGKILDPFADKMTQFTLTLCLSLKYPILRNVLALFVVKELFQLTLGIINLRKGKMLPGALMAGKICTTVLFISLIALVLLPDMRQVWIDLIAFVDTVFLAVAFVNYILAYLGKNRKVQDLNPGT